MPFTPCPHCKQQIEFNAAGLLLRQQLKRLENFAQRDDGWLTMKHILITTIAAVLLVGCGDQQATNDKPVVNSKQVSSSKVKRDYVDWGFLLSGKSQSEVKEIIGPPDDNKKWNGPIVISIYERGRLVPVESSSKMDEWIYYNLVFNETTEKFDSHLKIRFFYLLTPSTLKGNVRGGANFKEGVVAYYDGEFSQWRSTLYSMKADPYLKPYGVLLISHSLKH